MCTGAEARITAGAVEFQWPLPFADDEERH